MISQESSKGHTVIRSEMTRKVRLFSHGRDIERERNNNLCGYLVPKTLKIDKAQKWLLFPDTKHDH